MFEVAASKDVKPSQIALSWILHKGHDIVPIPGTKRRTHLEANVAADAIRLDPIEMQKLDAALAVARSPETATPTGSWRRLIAERLEPTDEWSAP